MSDQHAGRLRRLADELAEVGLPTGALGDGPGGDLLIEEVDRALRPQVHERRVASCGSILDPAADPATWARATNLEVGRAPTGDRSADASRWYADGLSSWLLRRTSGDDEWIMFDRPAGSERDLVVLARAAVATIVQRHPSGTVRIVGEFGVLRWNGLEWHHEPPVASWIDAISAGGAAGDTEVLTALLGFAVHDLGSLGIGALLIYRAATEAEPPGPPVEQLVPTPPTPPPLQIRTAFHLAPLRHALAQVDGAAVFDHAGVLRQLGVRIVPSADATERVDPFGGTRHTSGRRYSFDDPSATVIAVSADGPVSVLRNGEIIGRSSASL